MNGRFDIAVVGGGITGLTMAAQLTQTNVADQLHVCVIDASPRIEFDPSADIALRVSAISHGSAVLLEQIGAWQRVLDARYCAYDHMRVWDEAVEVGGASTLCFDADEFGVPHLGYIVENGLIQSSIADVLANTSVETYYGTSLKSINLTNSRQALTFENGNTMSVDLIVAADGARSMLREAAGIGVQTRPYAQTAFVTHVEPKRSHANTAWQRFLKHGPIGMLPLADGRISVVWSTTPANAEQAANCSETALGERLTEVSGRVIGDLRLAGPRGAFPLVAQHAESYVKHGIALIGDAAHTIHPLAGQGANLGLADAKALANTINEALERGEYAADRRVLRRYERERRGVNATMMHFMTGLNRLFASDSAVLGELRRAGMGLFNKSGPVRERMVGIALGGGRR